jgi:predicted metal-dependent hydrolase
MPHEVDEQCSDSMPIREIRFDFPEDVHSHWCENPQFSQIANAFMQALPYLEPYFIYNIREAATHISDPRLKA